MATHAQPTPISEVQRALQHVVVEANTPLGQQSSKDATKKRNKRATEVEGDDGNHRDPKKKRPDMVNAVVEDEHQRVQTRGTARFIVSEQGGHSKPRKRSKKKGKESYHQSPILDLETSIPVPQIDPQIDPQLQPFNPGSSATSAFLSAIVAAASATMESTSNQHIPPFSHPQYSHNTPAPAFHYREPPYLPMQYPYNIPQFGQSPQQSCQPFPGPLPSPLSELSNEDILRTLQELDISKIANVLKTLNDAASAANVPLIPQLAFESQHLPPAQQIQGHPTFGQTPVPSNTLLDKPPKAAKNQRKLDMTLPGPDVINPEHAEWLSTKWLNASKLAELVKTEGLVYKKGKFSAIEEQQLKDAIENYRVLKQLSHERLNDIIFTKNEKSKSSAFWSEITAAVPLRPIIAVYHHVRRGFHPLKQQGKWMPTEDALLEQAVTDLGQQWEKVSERVGRMSSDCRDRYRNHISNREMRVNGQWTKEEEDQLIRIVTEMTIDKGRNLDDDVFWGKVSERMENRRGRQQCRIKWTDSLSKTVKNKGEKPRWSQQDAYILVHKIDSLHVRDDTEIDWKILHDSHWNLWSAHSLQRRWLAMKRSVKGYEDMTHQEIMDILRVKKAQVPPPSTTTARKRKITSPAAVIDTEDSVEVRPAAGSSSGPGTLLAGCGPVVCGDYVHPITNK